MKHAAVLTLILLAACARSEDASAPPADANQTAVERVRPKAGDDQEPAIGAWRMALQGERPALEFGAQGTAALITIVCGEDRGLVLQRRGAVAPGASPTLALTVGGEGRPLQVTSGTGAVATLNAAIPAGDPLIRMVSEAQAPISLRYGDGAPLLLPPNPLVGQFAQSCAGGQGGRAPDAGGADGNAIGNEAEPAGNAAAPANETNAATAR